MKHAKLILRRRKIELAGMMMMMAAMLLPNIAKSQCAAPTNVAASKTLNSISLTWSDDSNPEAYLVEYGAMVQDGDTYSVPPTFQQQTTSTNSIILEGLELDTRYRVKITPYCGGTLSEYSYTGEYDMPKTYRVSASGTDTIQLADDEKYAVIYDMNGPNSNYNDNADGSLVVKAAPGKIPVITGGTYATAEDGDNLAISLWGHSIYDASFRHDFSGSGTLEEMTNYQRSIQIGFTSNGSGDGEGFAIEIKQVDMQYLPPYLTANIVTNAAGDSYMYSFSWSHDDRDLTETFEYLETDYNNPADTIKQEDNDLVYNFGGYFDQPMLFSVRAKYLDGNYSGWSNSIKISACVRGRSFDVSDITTNSAELTWDHPNTPLGYQVIYGEAPDGPGEPEHYDTVYVTDKQAALNSLADGTKYMYKVRSICSDEDTSAWTDTMSFTTKSCFHLTGVTVMNDNHAKVFDANSDNNGAYGICHVYENGISQGLDGSPISLIPNFEEAAEGLTYAWRKDGADAGTDDTLRNATEGTYTLTVSDGESCTAEMGDIKIVQGNEMNPGWADITNDCDGIGYGSIKARNILPQCTYGLYNGSDASEEFITPLTEEFQEIDNLALGQYSILTTDTLGCIITRNFGIYSRAAEEVRLVSIEETPDSNKCGQSDVAITVEGGVPPYTFSGTYTKEDGTLESFNNFQNETTFYNYNVGPGEFTLQSVKDGCDVSAVQDTSITVKGNPPTNINVTPASATRAELTWESMGTMTEVRVTTAAEGQPVMQFFANGTDTTIRNLEGSTTYNVELRSICGEGDTSGWSEPVELTTMECYLWYLSSFSLMDNNDPSPQNSINFTDGDTTMVMCYGIEYLLEVSYSDWGNWGISPTQLTYEWTKDGETMGVNSVTVQNVEAGTYHFKATDANECSVESQNITLVRDVEIPEISYGIEQSCSEEGGNLWLNTEDGIEEFTFPVYAGEDDGGEFVQNLQPGNTTLTLPPGRYNLLTTTPLGCTSDTTITIYGADVTEPVVEIVEIDQVSCTTGNVTVSVSGGALPYQYTMEGSVESWGSYDPEYTYENLAAGTYTLKVLGRCNQTTQVEAVVHGTEMPTDLSVDYAPDDVVVFNWTNPTANTHIVYWREKGTTDWDSIWAIGEEDSDEQSRRIELRNYSGADYEFALRAVCDSTDSIYTEMSEIKEFTPPCMDAAENIHIHATAEGACSNEEGGNIRLSPRVCGVGGYNFLVTITDENDVVQREDSSDSLFTDLGPGEYNIQMDIAGYSVDTTVTIEYKIQLNLDFSDPGLCMGNPITATAVANGGTQPYSYEWDGIADGNERTAEIELGPESNFIACTVSDGNGCTSSLSKYLSGNWVYNEATESDIQNFDEGYHYNRSWEVCSNLLPLEIGTTTIEGGVNQEIALTAMSGCDSVVYYDLTIDENNWAVPSMGHQTQTLTGGDTTYIIYDYGHNSGNYLRNSDGSLTLQGQEGYTLQLESMNDAGNSIIHIARGDTLFVYDGTEATGTPARTVTWDLIDMYNISVGSPIPGYTSQSRALTFRLKSGSNVPSNGFALSVKQEGTETMCMAPYNVSSQSNYTTIDLNWECQSTPEQFKVEYGAMPGTMNNETGQMEYENPADYLETYVTANAVALSGLTIGTRYKVVITPICGGLESEYQYIGEFSTSPAYIVPESDESFIQMPADQQYAIVYDHNGPNNNYREDASGTLYLTAAPGKTLMITGGNYHTEDIYDKLQLGEYHPEYGKLNVTNYTGIGSIEAATSGTRSFYFTFEADGSVNKEGFEIEIEQIDMNCLAPITPITTSKNVVDDGVAYQISWGHMEDADKFQVALVDLANPTDTIFSDTIYDVMSYEFHIDATKWAMVRSFCEDWSGWTKPILMSACLPSSDFEVTDITKSTATISWQHEAGASYQIAYGRAHMVDGEWVEDPDSGDENWVDYDDPVLCFADSAEFVIADETSLTLTRLDANTLYKYEIRSICGEGDTGEWVRTADMMFRTACGFTPYETATVFETYDSDGGEWRPGEDGRYCPMPDCWSRIPAYTDPVISREFRIDGMAASEHDTLPMIGSDGDGGKNLYFGIGVDQDQIAVLPEFDVTDTSVNAWALNLSYFFLYKDDFDGGDEPVAEEEVNHPCLDDSVMVVMGVMSDPNDRSTFVPTDTTVLYRHSNNNLLSMKAYTGTGTYPAIMVPASDTLEHVGDISYLVLNEISTVPDYGIEAPTNIRIDRGPQEGQYLIYWDAPTTYIPGYNSGFIVTYWTNDRNNAEEVFVNYNPYSIIDGDLRPGSNLAATVATQIRDANNEEDLGWCKPSSEIARYQLDVFERQEVDFVGNMSDQTYDEGVPFKMKNESGSKMIFLNNELTVDRIDAISYRTVDDGCYQWIMHSTGKLMTPDATVRVYMANTDATSVDRQENGTNYFADTTEMQLVAEFSEETEMTPGWNTIVLDTPFTREAGKNVSIVTTYTIDRILAADGDDYPAIYTSGPEGMAYSVSYASGTMPTQDDSRATLRPQMKFFKNASCEVERDTLVDNICSGHGYEWNGRTIGNDGDAAYHRNHDFDTYESRLLYYDTIANAATNGCDSIHTLILVERDNPENEIDTVSCGPVTWVNGIVVDHSVGTHSYPDPMTGCPLSDDSGEPEMRETITGVAEYGCDSVYILNLKVLPFATISLDLDLGTTPRVDTLFSCMDTDYVLPDCPIERQNYLFMGWLYTHDDGLGGKALVTDTVQPGAIIMITEDITLKAAWKGDCEDKYAESDAYMCVANVDTWHGQTIDINTWRANNGVYTDTIYSAVPGGCDSIYIHRVGINSAYDDEITACELGIAWRDSNTYTQTVGVGTTGGVVDYGYYTDAPYVTIQKEDGECDSVIFLHLYINEAQGVGKVIYLLSEQQPDTLYVDTICAGDFTARNCDTVREGWVFDTWSDNPACGWSTAPSDTGYVSAGDTVTYYGMWRSTCTDSIINEDTALCVGETLFWRGQWVSAEGRDLDYDSIAYFAIPGDCNIKYQMRVTPLHATFSDTVAVACDEFTWHEVTYTASVGEDPAVAEEAAEYTLQHANADGCDSTIRLHLTINYGSDWTRLASACDEFTFDNGETYYESTDEPMIVDTTAEGCLMIQRLNLTIFHGSNIELTEEVCDQFEWFDNEFHESGDYSLSDLTADGCDSTVTLHLTIHHPSEGIDAYSVCDSLTWIDGNTYYDEFSPDMFGIEWVLEGADQFGCDSIVKLDLTIIEHLLVNFISDFGDGFMEPVEHCYTEPLAIPECEYIYDGSHFMGWIDQSTGDTVQPGDTVYIFDNTTFSAGWERNCWDAYGVTDTIMCTGDSLIWHGHDYTDELFSGEYEYIAYGAVEGGCDSIYMLMLNVYPTSFGEIFDTATNNYMWHGYTFNTSGDYSAVVGMNRYGCDSTETLHLVIVLGIDEIELNVNVYPNPTTGLIHLEGVEVKKVRVLDLVGRTLISFENTNDIDISQLSSGIYTLYIMTDEGNCTRRIVKQ